MNDSPMLLHVYGQEAWHAPARIVGTRDALKELAYLLHTVIYQRHTPTPMPTFFVNDGEGYSVEIVCRTEAEMDTEPRPYVGDYTKREA